MIETRAQAVTLSWPAWKQIDDHSDGNTNGSNNTAIDLRALFFNSTGSENTAVGARALLNGGGGSNNIALGYSAGSSLVQAVNNIDIGNVVPFSTSTIRIGDVQTATYIPGQLGHSFQQV